MCRWVCAAWCPAAGHRDHRGARERQLGRLEDVLVNISQRTYSLASRNRAHSCDPARRRGSESAPGELVDPLDGLVLSGGADLDPSSYGAEPHPATFGYRIERDRFEIALAAAALERDMPVLGICRGMQLLNVACGGTLDQHLADRWFTSRSPGAFSRSTTSGSSPIRWRPRALGAEQVEGSLASPPGRRARWVRGWWPPAGRSRTDSSRRSRCRQEPFALGCIWHPEERRARAPRSGPSHGRLARRWTA